MNTSGKKSRYGQHVRMQKNHRERLLDSQLYLPSKETDFLSIREALREVRRRAALYGNPLPLKTRIGLQMEERLLNVMGVAPESMVLFSPVVPLRWKKVFDYLFEKGLITEPCPILDEIYNDDVKIFGLQLWAVHRQEDTDADVNRYTREYARGVSFDFEEALSKVVGEFLERYPLSLYRRETLLHASIAEIRRRKTHFFDPFLLDQFSPRQKNRFPSCRFDDSSGFCWVKGKSLMTEKGAFIPAQLVYWNYGQEKKEPFLQQSTTNGAGGMFHHVGAVMSGLYELIQRDAFFIFWLNSIAPPRIDINSLEDEEIRCVLRSCDRNGIDVFILNTTSDFGIPCMTTVLIDRYVEGPSVTLGGGCNVDVTKAIMRSLTEAIGVRYRLRGIMKRKSYHLPEQGAFFGGEPSNQTDRLLYWSNPGMQEKINFFLSGTVQNVKEICRDFNRNICWTPERELRYVKSIFRKRGERYEIFYYEARHEILDVLGYSSVKVVVPALLPLYMAEDCAPLGNPRIQEACQALGYVPAKDTNPLPHPFP